jgi:hypothetical protein
MNDNELKKILKNIDIPAPSEEGKARAMQAAMQAFEKNHKGFQKTIRPISTPTHWEQLKRSFTMKKAYVFAGSFAAIAVVLAVTTTHYSTIMQPLAIAPLAQPQTTQTDGRVGAETDQKSLAKNEQQTITAAAAPESTIDHSAPGMQSSLASASPPPPLAAAPAQKMMAARSADSALVGASEPGVSALSYAPPPPPYNQPYYQSDDLTSGNLSGEFIEPDTSIKNTRLLWGFSLFTS